MTMFCKECGNQIPDSATVCMKCGVPTGTAQAQTVNVPNYLVQAILCTVFCCVPFGIVGIVYAAQVNGHLGRGDISAAQIASRKARTWCWVSFGVGIVTYIALVLLGVLGEMVSNYGG
jgi:TRAP-type C4-dicarboxylate transport system permease small subunit